MSDQSHPGTRFRLPEDREMIPRVLVRAMFALAMASLAIVSFAVLTDQTHVGQPKPAEILESRQLILEGYGSKAVTVRDPSGQVILDLDHGGFIAVILNGLSRERTKHGVEPGLPLDLVRYANGRLTVHDPETQWSAELGSFGDGNKAAFERLFSEK